MGSQAKITSCSTSPTSPDVRDEWVPVATVDNHSYSGRLSKELYVRFTIEDRFRGLTIVVDSTRAHVPEGNSHTFENTVPVSWPKELKEEPEKQLSLFLLKWFPGTINLKCELMGWDIAPPDEHLDTETALIEVQPSRWMDNAEARISEGTCRATPSQLVPGEALALGAETKKTGKTRNGLQHFAVEYWVHEYGRRIYHTGDVVMPGEKLSSDSSVSWSKDRAKHEMSIGSHTLDCALWGHRISPAYEPTNPLTRLQKWFFAEALKLLEMHGTSPAV